MCLWAWLFVLLEYFIMLVFMLIGMAFFTLLEQKVLGLIQIRLGPVYSGYWGLLQPFSDAVKLLSKETMVLRVSNHVHYFCCPIISLFLSMYLWMCHPFCDSVINLEWGVLFFMVLTGLGVYPILFSGWSSNCKYSMLGALRSVAQMVSYELSLSFILLSIVWMSGFNFLNILSESYWLFICMPIMFLWFISSLAETNRTPYDFSEGESELVSGFNTEYLGGGFTIIFMSEYVSILFMSLLFVIFFFGSTVNFFFFFKVVFVGFMFIWVRGTLPRYRYDKLMNLAWKSFLPISLMMLVYFFFFGLMA